VNILKADSLFRSLIENSHAGIFIIDNAFHITYANNRLAEILGYSQAEIIGSDFRRFLDEESCKLVSERYIRRQKGESLPSRYEFSFFHRDGQKRYAELSSAVYKDSGGDIHTIGQLLDITERKNTEAELKKAHDELELRVEQRTAELRLSNTLLLQEIEEHQKTQDALRRSESKYRHLIENANSIILEMDPRGNVIFMNKYALDFFGYCEKEILGKSVIGTIVPQVDSSGNNLTAMIDELVSHPEKYVHNENENLRSNGEKVWIIWTNQPVYDEDGKLKEILCIGINRTEQKRAEEQMAHRLKEKATREERTRLARDLHDAVSQTLFSASLIAEVIPRLWERNTEEGRKQLEEIRQLTRGALAEMRTLLLELRPAALADAEISDLIRQLAESITGRARIPVMVEVTGHCALNADTKIALYRIAQEALNNVAKHSGASSSRVSLNCQPHRVQLVISDNGKGFDQEKIQAESLGIGIMKERARGIGADQIISSIPGKGTEVRVNWKNSMEAE